MKPPAVVLNGSGAEMQFDGVRQWGLDWSNVREIAIRVCVAAELGYSEAFWKITGPVVDFSAPVELVVGADEFNARLLEFSGFDRTLYQRAREAEQKAESGFFVRWRENASK